MIAHSTRCYPSAPRVPRVITVLSGGVGAARLLRALSGVMDPSELCAVVNVGDDLVLHGLTICPDLDTINYTLAGLNNDELGWGLRGETWRVNEELAALGGESWFRLGDRDLATHLYRTQRLAEGATKSQVTAELSRRWGVAVRLLPVTNDPIATEFDTEIGRLSFQEYFVRHQHDVRVHSVRVRDVEAARPTDEVLEALRGAERIVIAPSNPIISIDPILQVPGVREIVRRRSDDVVAVSPIINGVALKGPADRLLFELGHEVSCVGVADVYSGLVGRWIIDEADRDQTSALEERGLDVRVTTTVMARSDDARRLAEAVLA
ncbi:MAG: 2-phospho-L-lactate transferase [Acidimicrobiaceae bacterium]|nr:2-phospho-L-lactate transferase [Acidimicrobiaceae bacterium]